MKVNIKKTSIEDCYVLEPKVIKDKRGTFVKTFHEDVFGKYNLATNFKEEYYSVSHKGVLRGMHFQTPPYDHVKLVYCVVGKVLDVVVDLRINSNTYGKFEMFDLNADTANMIYIPKGMAHGFYVVSDSAIMMYKVTTTYHPENDSGVKWDSIGIPWPNVNPIISERDQKFKTLNQIEKLFFYKTYEELI